MTVVRAIWVSKDFDIPVVVVPEPTEKGKDGREYQKVQHDGSESYVPVDELRIEGSSDADAV
jgi:hypothetical protein